MALGFRLLNHPKDRLSEFSISVFCGFRIWSFHCPGVRLFGVQDFVFRCSGYGVVFQASTELMQAQAVLGGIHVSQNGGPKGV